MTGLRLGFTVLRHSFKARIFQQQYIYIYIFFLKLLMTNTVSHESGTENAMRIRVGHTEWVLFLFFFVLFLTYVHTVYATESDTAMFMTSVV